MAISKTYELTRQLAAAMPEEQRTREGLRALLWNAMCAAPHEWLRPTSPEEVAEMLAITPEALKVRRWRGTADHPPLWEETLDPSGKPREALPGRTVRYADRVQMLLWISGIDVRAPKQEAAA